ncbi:MAG: phosphatidylserine decarboxylase family protein [candidate division Zixibacteria bacterium]|nr:phosphatidylserine decarboxylase family protein [candidate division Zixibacteria bacterium]
MIYFFRDPERRIPPGEGKVLSPVDGKVLKVEDSDSGSKSLSIFLSPFNVHINRIPVSGKIVDIRRKPGRFFAAYKPQAEKENCSIETDILTQYGLVTVRQVVGVLARRLVNRLNIGDEVKPGQRFGMMRFGSRLDLILPVSIELKISKGIRVKGGVTIIGEFKDA